MKLENYNHLFEFLTSYGYLPVQSNNDNCIIYEGENNKVIIEYTEYSLELSCQFEDKCSEKSFSLQDFIKYQCIEGCKGIYQLTNINDLNKGLIYIANIIKEMYLRLDISSILNFDSVYDYTLKKRKEALDEYYINLELKKADHYWKQKEFTEACKIYAKHKKQLSKSQNKRLSICHYDNN